MPRKAHTIIAPDGKIDRRIFIDQAIYDEEMAKIRPCLADDWAREPSASGYHDFFHTYMGEDLVIPTRTARGRLYRVSERVPTAPWQLRGGCDDGNARHFMCTYQYWTYANDGTLEYVPGESEAHYNALDRSSLGLIEARVDTYAGIVFATWAADALQALEAYLGDARWYLDTVFNRRDCGMQALGPMKWLGSSTGRRWWTTAPTTIMSLPATWPVSWSTGAATSVARGFCTRSSSRARTSTSVNGHSLTLSGSGRQHPQVRARHVAGHCPHLPGALQCYLLEVERRLGTFRARKVQLGNHSLFPNGVLGLRLGTPARGPKTEFCTSCSSRRTLQRRSNTSSGPVARRITVLPGCSSKTISTTGVR